MGKEVTLDNVPINHTNCMCRLCGRQQNLRGSHIVPKFFYRFIKKNSPTGRFRSAENPRLPVQDGKKTPFLCAECEEKFSKYETLFFSHIYQKFSTDFGVSCFSTDSNKVKYFTLSIAWRVLKFQNEKGMADLSGAERKRIDDVLEEWRKALYEEDFIFINQVEQYIVPTARLGSYFCQKDAVYDRDMTSKITSNVCADFKAYDKQDEFKCAFTTVQVPYLVFITKVWGKVDGLDEFRIGNEIIPKDFEIPLELIHQLDYFHKEKFAEADKEIPDSQREEILKRALENTSKQQ